MTNSFVKWPSIEGFSQVWRNHSKMFSSEARPISFIPKIKLHGTNAAVRVTADGIVTAQKRSSDIDVFNDNLGFAAWVAGQRDYFARMAAERRTIIVYGEWAGPGVQKGVAVSKLASKRFFPFAIYDVEDDWIHAHPEFIANHMGEHPDVTVLPWYSDPIVIDMADEVGTRAKLEVINEHVARIDAVDPFIRDTFGIEGVGEGLVFYPGHSSLRNDFSSLAFKVKGAQHTVNKDDHGRPAHIETWVTASVKEFVDRFVTPARLEQALQEACGGVPDMRMTGDFLKWIGGDVKKESRDELEASCLDWARVAKMVNLAAVTWYKQRAATYLPDVAAAA